jgi:hypothetical protein
MLKQVYGTSYAALAHGQEGVRGSCYLEFGI